jgi:methylated-DNA-[protein]-cysteine S-methyltransferase
MNVIVGPIATPLGAFGAAVSPRGLGRLTFPDEPLSACVAWANRWLPEAQVVRDEAVPAPVAQQLVAYLAGARRDFDLPLDLRGTPFQLQVWEALRAIPYGQVRSYADLAATIGRPNAVRAVGLANGANPVPVVVPCHRVVGRNGTLTGYGGGLALKARLLQLEGVSLRDLPNLLPVPGPPGGRPTPAPHQAALLL